MANYLAIGKCRELALKTDHQSHLFEECSRYLKSEARHCFPSVQVIQDSSDAQFRTYPQASFPDPSSLRHSPDLCGNVAGVFRAAPDSTAHCNNGD